MTLPTSGSISIDQIKAELGITGELSLTDQRVRDLAGIQSGSLMMPNDFWGKSSRTVSLIITSYEQVKMGFGDWGRQQYDKITFGISVSPYLAPTSYAWGGDVFGNSATAVFMGPAYQVMGYTYQNSGTAYCSVVVGGRTYELSLDFQYTAGDAV